MVYADYVASERAQRHVEDFVATHVFPNYANSHTEASYCGAYMTDLRRQAWMTFHVRSVLIRTTRWFLPVPVPPPG
ncbi:hypothetical protein [Sedimentitalea nanhaiensis]|uniref:hypothetical protein n=1 Tax=Sedimentitalea nanhaiensis TaxID=999627 RepID=UPI000419AD41|nr:hypothetical protein [Sedimentitalea nanhaiensis]